MLTVKMFPKIYLKLLGLLLILLVLTTCSNQVSPNESASPVVENAKAIASCDASASLGFCYDYTGSGWTSEKIELDCGFVEDNLLQAESCSQESVVATCSFDLQGNPELAIIYYFYQPMELSEAERMCPGTLFPAD